MLFHSYVFLFVFLPVVLAGFAVLSRLAGRRAALGWLVAGSLFYYGWWNPPYLALLGGSMAFNFAVGLRLQRADPAGGGGLLAAGVAVNLGLLGWFKYAGFLADSINAATGAGLPSPEVILPVGISFFTFQQIAFLVDARRGEAREVRFLDYCLFVTFFPQLIAGPIVHHAEMLPQFLRRRAGALSARDLALGGTLFLVGLFKKVVLADNAALFATPVFAAADGGSHPAFAEAWIGTLAYTLQLYFDFSGYSDMAIGLGRMFGIRLPLNFHSPYKAVTVVDFWRRWHMTLSRFLRDYLYFPLGGNLRGPVRRYGNLMATMLLGGLWHGAGWTFVAWGCLHGLYLCANHAWAAAARRLGWAAERPGVLRVAAARGATFLAVAVAWVFFRAETFAGAGRLLAGLSGSSGFAAAETIEAGRALPWVIPLLAVVWFLPNTQQWARRWRPALEYGREDGGWGEAPVPDRAAWRPTVAWALAMVVLGTVTIAQMAKASEFIYYQF